MILISIMYVKLRDFVLTPYTLKSSALLVDIAGYVSELYRIKASSHSSTCNVKQQTDVACTCCCGLLVFTLSLSLLSVSSPFSTVGLLVQGGEYCARPFSRNLTCLHEIWI